MFLHYHVRGDLHDWFFHPGPQIPLHARSHVLSGPRLQFILAVQIIVQGLRDGFSLEVLPALLRVDINTIDDLTDCDPRLVPGRLR